MLQAIENLIFRHIVLFNNEPTKQHLPSPLKCLVKSAPLTIGVTFRLLVLTLEVLILLIMDTGVV